MEEAPPPQKSLNKANMIYMANMTSTARWLDFNMTECLMAEWLDGKIAGLLDGFMAIWPDGYMMGKLGCT